MRGIGVRSVWTSLALAAACKYEPPQIVVDGPAIDAPAIDALDAPPDVGIDAQACFGTYTTICLAMVPSAPRTFDANVTLDTDGSQCVDTGTTAAGLCVLAATDFTINAGVVVTATGARPLVLLATEGAITVDGTIDVSSTVGGRLGAGRGSAASCNAGTPPINDGGGQGGSFGVAGGNGGDGSGFGNGVAGAAITLAAGEVRGGCSGTRGADGRRPAVHGHTSTPLHKLFLH